MHPLVRRNLIVLTLLTSYTCLDTRVYGAVFPWWKAGAYSRQAKATSAAFSEPVLLHLQHYADNDLKLRKFVPIIQRSLVYPVILDARRTVLSLPPIINGAHSAVRPCCICYLRHIACNCQCANVGRLWHSLRPFLRCHCDIRK